MITTPTLQKSFTANFDSLAGTHLFPQTTGLANGNVLVTWTDDTKGQSPGTDIFGQIFDPFGKAIGRAFQVNSQSTVGDEMENHIAAMPDGGFVTVFRIADDDRLRVERYDAARNLVSTAVIEDTTLNGGYSITATTDGDYCVTFSTTRTYFKFPVVTPLLDTNVAAIVFDGRTNGTGPRIAGARNSEGYAEFNSASAVLANGNFVSVYEAAGLDEPANLDYIQFRVFDQFGNLADDRFDVALGVDPEVAALAGGEFVIMYRRYEDFFYKVFDARGGQSGEFEAAAFVSPLSKPVIVALKDGGFFIGWDSQNKTFGQRCDSHGDPVGDIVTLATGAQAGTLDLGLTSDGRILAAFKDAAGQITELVLDPRESTIVGTAGNDVLTARTTSSTVFAGAGNDKVFGLASNDTIYGEDDNDTINGGDGIDTIFGGAGDDVIKVGNNERSDNVDGGAGRDALDLRAISSRSAVVDLAAGTWHLTPGFLPILQPTAFGPIILPSPMIITNTIAGIETVFGTLGGDILSGSAAADRLYGSDGSDTLIGGAGNDGLVGGKGNDLIVGGLGKDTMIGDAGADTFAFNAVAETPINSASNDFIFDFESNNTDRLDISGIDAIDGGANDAFTFIGTGPFTAAGQVRVVFFNGNTLIDMNTGGTLVPDARIILSGTVQIDVTDFIL